MAARTILIIDDDRDTVAFVRAALEPIGMKVISAEDGDKGLDFSSGTPPIGR